MDSYLFVEKYRTILPKALVESFDRKYSSCFEAYSIDPDALNDSEQAYAGYLIKNCCRNKMKEYARNGSVYPQLVYGQVPGFVEKLEGKDINFSVKYDRRTQGDGMVAMDYDNTTHTITVYIYAMCHNASIQLNPNMNQDQINSAVLSAINLMFDDDFSKIENSVGELIVHENRHRLDDISDPNFLNDNEEFGRVLADYDFYNSVKSDADAYNYQPKSKVSQNDRKFLVQFGKQVSLKPNLNDRVKLHIQKMASQILNEQFNRCLYNKNLPDGLVRELEKIRYSITPEEMLSALRPNLTDKLLREKNYSAIRDLYNDQTLTDEVLSKDPESVLSKYKAEDKIAADSLKAKNNQYAWKMYYNQIAEINAFITQKVMYIAMLKKSNYEDIDVDKWVDILFGKMGGKYIIPDLAVQAKNRLYTLLMAANNIKLSRDCFTPIQRVFAMQNEIKKLSNH